MIKRGKGGDTKPFVLWSLDAMLLVSTNPTLTLKEGQRGFQAIEWLDYGRSSLIDGDMLRPLHRSLLEPKPIVVKARAKDGHFHLHLAESKVLFKHPLYLKIPSRFIHSSVLSFLSMFNEHLEEFKT